MQDFHNLLVWRRAHELALHVDRLARQFPRAGSASLKSQLCRAADSIAANIVEGCGAATQREFARYLDIAIKSSSETEYHLLNARDRSLLPPADCDKQTDELTQIRRMLFALRKQVLLSLNPSSRLSAEH